jgi:acyl-CoA synthetase (AMP-forming)/AMP-acid ligase II
VLRGCEGVFHATVIARVVPRNQATAAFTEDLKSALASRLPQHMRPSQIHFLDAIPQLPGYKTDIRALEDHSRSKGQFWTPIWSAPLRVDK